MGVFSSKNTIFIENFSVNPAEISRPRRSKPTYSPKNSSQNERSEENTTKYGKKRDSFSYLKSNLVGEDHKKNRASFITKDYLKKLQNHENPFQEVDIALGTPRVLKKYVFDEMKLGQGKYSEFTLETVRDENVNGKNKEKEDIMKAFLQHKVNMLKEEKSRQVASKNQEASRSPQRDEKHSSNEIQTESNIGTARRFSKTFYFQNELNSAKPERKSRESLSKLSKTGLSKNVIILESMVEKEDGRKGTITRKGGKKRTIENFSKKHPEFDKSQLHKNISTISKTTNQKKVLLESDDEDNAYEMKEIEPLMILAHQNVKPIKYIFNQKYMGEKITDNDKRFLNPRLPNLFKDKKAGQVEQVEDNYPENIQIKKDYEIPALNSSLFPRENKDTSTISRHGHDVSQNKTKTFQKI